MRIVSNLCFPKAVLLHQISIRDDADGQGIPGT